YLDFKINSIIKLLKTGQSLIGRTFKDAGLLQDYKHRLITDAVIGKVDLRNFNLNEIEIPEEEVLSEEIINEPQE
ncbi:MAG: hypothetical protein Q7T72_12825, partial [Bacteroidales bacterium]|nr:hypothetical protein [Bacteroidales bacterium]